MSQVDPSFGRDAELHEYATSDLSVEEQLAGGASVDDLVEAGVLQDDYDPDNDPDYFFTTEPPERAFTPGPPMPKEEFKALLEVGNSFEYCGMAADFRRKAAQCRTERLRGNAPDSSL